MHKIQISFGAATGEMPVPVKVVLDGHELQGVASVEIALDEEGVTSVVLRLVSSTTIEDNPPPRSKRESAP